MSKQIDRSLGAMMYVWIFTLLTVCMTLYITHVMIVGKGGGGGATQLSMKMIKRFAPANNVLSFSYQGFIG